MHRLQISVSILLLCAVGPLMPADGQIGVELVTDEAINPMLVAHAPGDPNHLFIAERAGRVRVFDLQANAMLPTPLLDVRGEIFTGGEGGFLGLAFHPDFQENGQFFAYVSDSPYAGGNHASYVRRYEVQEDNRLVADPDVEETVLRFTQPQANHNAGWIGFSPVDNYLYIASGDGGGGNDSGTGHTSGIGNAQDITDNWLGKMLRVDVDGDDFPMDDHRNYAVPPDNPFVGVTGDGEIFAYGLRNPFRDGFDRANGDLYIGDVGQSAREEIDFLPAGSDGGQNYGWRLREGFIQTPEVGIGGPRPPDNVDPIYDYPRSGPNSGNVVTGGTVYRGPVADLQGRYIFADFGSDLIWSFHYDGIVVNDFENITSALDPPGASLNNIVAFGEDAIGDMYIVELSDGQIWRITGPAAVGDFNRDAVVDRADLDAWQANVGTLSGATPSLGDADDDGDVDGHDLLDYLLAFGSSALDVPAGTTALNAASAAVPEPGTFGLLTALVGLAVLRLWHCNTKS